MKAKHVLTLGDSGSGKTTLNRERHARKNGISIWVNHNGESNVAGKRVRGHRAMRNAVQSCRDTAEVRNLRFNLRCDDPLEGVETARDFGQQVADHFGPETVETQIVVDECQHVIADKSSRDYNAADWILHEGRDEGIIGQFATQDPTAIDYTPIKQCRWFSLCGMPATFHQGFINAMQWPDSTWNAWKNTQDHQYLVLDKQANVVSKGETRKKFS